MKSFQTDLFMFDPRFLTPPIRIFSVTQMKRNSWPHTSHSVAFSGLINKSLVIEVLGLFVLRVTPVPAVCVASTCSHTGYSPQMSCVLWTNSECSPGANALIYSTNMGSKKSSQIWHTEIESQRNHIIFSTRIVSFKLKSKCKHYCQKAPCDYIIQQCINKSSVMLAEV